MSDKTPTDTPADEDYQRAVQRAGVIELPDSGDGASTHDQVPDVPAGQSEDDNPPGASQ